MGLRHTLTALVVFDLFSMINRLPPLPPTKQPKQIVDKSEEMIGSYAAQAAPYEKKASTGSWMDAFVSFILLHDLIF